MLAALGLLLLGAGVGTIGTIIGAGGGFILVPVLALFDPNLPAANVTAISFGMIVFNAASGSVAYLRQRRVDLASAIPFAIATLPGGVLGAIATHAITRGTFDVLFGLMLIALALFIVFRRPPATRAASRGRWTVHREWTDASGTTHSYDVNLALGMAFSLAIGFAASLFGIGGGTILVPLLVAVLAFPPHIATATSTFVLLVTAIAGTITHLGAGDLDGFYGETVMLGIGALAGGQIGAKLAPRIGSRALVRFVAVALGFAGVRLAARAFL